MRRYSVAFTNKRELKMATFTVLDGRDPMLMVDLLPGDQVIAESNAMVMSDGNVSVEGQLQGGVLSSIARKLFTEETLFQQVFTADKGRSGQVFLAPQLPGDIEVVDIGERQFFLNSGCYLASEATVNTATKLNSSVLGSFFGSTGGLMVMRTEGRGKLCLCGFGQVLQVDVKPDEEVVIDNGHVVAWDTALEYRVSTASSKRGLFGRMMSTAMSGEYLVTRFSGSGKVYISTRNQVAFEDYVKSLGGIGAK